MKSLFVCFGGGWGAFTAVQIRHPSSRKAAKGSSGFQMCSKSKQNLPACRTRKRWDSLQDVALHWTSVEVVGLRCQAQAAGVLAGLCGTLVMSRAEQGEPGPQLCPVYESRSWSLGCVSHNHVRAGYCQSHVSTPLDGSCALGMLLCPQPGPCPPCSPGGEVWCTGLAIRSSESRLNTTPSGFLCFAPVCVCWSSDPASESADFPQHASCAQSDVLFIWFYNKHREKSKWIMHRWLAYTSQLRAERWQRAALPLSSQRQSLFFLPRIPKP